MGIFAECLLHLLKFVGELIQSSSAGLTYEPHSPASHSCSCPLSPKLQVLLCKADVLQVAQQETPATMRSVVPAFAITLPGNHCICSIVHVFLDRLACQQLVTNDSSLMKHHS